MSLISNDLIRNIASATEKEEHVSSMATVASISNGKVYLKYYGETEASQKPTKRVSSYTPAVGDTVILQNINGSLVIVGKVV